MADVLRRGFKAEAERLAVDLRAELGLSVRDRLDPRELAEHLGIPVLPLTELAGDLRNPMSLRRATAARAGFSAATICAGSRRLIVFNPAHPPGRRANSLAHELSHVLLDHPPQPAIGHGGGRRWDGEREAEADWQAGALLVPREGALWWMAKGGTIESGAVHFGVSVDLFKWRVNQTGVTKQLRASRARRPSFSASVRDAMKEVSRQGPPPDARRAGSRRDFRAGETTDAQPRPRPRPSSLWKGRQDE